MSSVGIRAGMRGLLSGLVARDIGRCGRRTRTRRAAIDRLVQPGGARIHAARTGRDGGRVQAAARTAATRSEEHTSELQSLMRISYAVFCLKKKKIKNNTARKSIQI